MIKALTDEALDRCVLDQTYPLKYVQEVLAWSAERAGKKAMPLKDRGDKTYRFQQNGDKFDLVKSTPLKKSPKVMVCHDMRGGYLEDRFFDGCTNIADEPYRLVHWALIDTWIYFSHNFITIPPWGWIQAAHTNGVKVLGTIITEWKDGEGLCDEFLADDETSTKFAIKCAEMARDVGFEGWLLNIENHLKEELIPRMKNFVRRLTEEMHKLVPGSLVIWYDSVTMDGRLKWQNELNDLNYAFFESCDGIFLNYNWRVDEDVNSIANSLKTLKEHGKSQRNLDIYFGIDVFGRGTYGGGGFDAYKAFEAVNMQTSMAIFAPGWTHEQSEEGSNFIQREYKFWNLLRPFVTHKARKFSAAKLTNSSIDGVINVQLTFHNGVGRKPEGWFLDYSKERVMPPAYNISSSSFKTDTDFKDCPFLLSHNLDFEECVPSRDCLNVFSEEGGLSVSRWKGREWSFMGVENAVPIILCHLDLQEAVSITVIADFTTSTNHSMEVQPKMFARYYRPDEEDNPVIECLSALEPMQLNTITYKLDLKSPVSFLDCLLMEAEAKYPNCLVLKSCQIKSFLAKAN